MKYINILVAAFVVIFFAQCDDEETTVDGTGDITVMFQNFAGDEVLTFVTEGSDNFSWSSNGQNFNVDMMGYYISEIKLTGEDGSEFVDFIETSADASEGFYQIIQNADGTTGNMISLEDVPAGNYDQITFTVGVSGDIVEEGAQGGVLDPSQGAWFWNWNVGYIGFAIEGSAEDSGSEDGLSYAFHVGGWDEPNNVKEITLDLPIDIAVGNETSSMVNLAVDALEFLSGDQMTVDFSTDFAIHSPVAGEDLGNNLSKVFTVHHIENN